MKYKKVYIGFLDTYVIFTYGRKSYSKYLKKSYNIDKTFNSSGIATELQSNKLYHNVIGLQKNNKCKTTLEGVMLHEVSHVVTHIMDHFAINCDEFRAYMNQYLFYHGNSFIKEVH